MTRRRSSRVGQTCPGCGKPIRWVRFVPDPHRRSPGTLSGRIPLDLPRVADDDEAGEYAATAGLTTCRRLGPGDAIALSEYRHTHHAVTSPACRADLFPPQQQPTARRRTA